MFKNIKELFSNNRKCEVKSVKRFVFNTDCKIRASGFFKINDNLVTDLEDKEKLQDTVRQELLNEKDFGYLASRTRNTQIKVISIGHNIDKSYTVHFEMETHFYNNRIADNDLSAKLKAENYLREHTDILFYLNKIKGLGYETEIELNIKDSKEVVFFEGEDGYEDNG